MARRKKPAVAENHERWLVSYADFITLLFAFFVVMFASSQTDKGRAQKVSDSVKRALEENQVASTIAGILGGAADDKGRGNAMMRGPGGVNKAQAIREPEKNGKIAELQAAQQFLDRELKTAIEQGKLRIMMTTRGLVVSLQEAAFFPPGDDVISPEAYPSLEKIADALRQLPNQIRLEGHTDSIPINNDRFRSNWELSTGRAIAMLEILSSQLGVPTEKLAVAGYADTAPVASNDTAEGRAKNRRVDVIILNQTGMISEPIPASPSSR